MTELAQAPSGSANIPNTPARVLDALPLGRVAGMAVLRGPSYRIDRAMTLILQNMLAGLGQGVQDHSVFFADTAAGSSAHCHRSTGPSTGPTTTTPDRRCATSTWHAGELPEDFTTEENRGRYHALDPDTYFWAHATFFDQAMYFTDTFVRRLSALRRSRCTSSRRPGIAATASPTGRPPTTPPSKYWDHMINEVLVAPTSTASATSPRASPAQGVSPLAWKVLAPLFRPLAALFLTTGGMPPRTREILGLPWDDRRAALSAVQPTRCADRASSTGCGAPCR